MIYHGLRYSEKQIIEIASRYMLIQFPCQWGTHALVCSTPRNLVVHYGVIVEGKFQALHREFFIPLGHDGHAWELGALMRFLADVYVIVGGD